jgi:hypothetical protein
MEFGVVTTASSSASLTDTNNYDFCDAVMPDTWVAADWKAKKQAMR